MMSEKPKEAGRGIERRAWNEWVVDAGRPP
jgi:hypothetical protein